MSTHLVLRNFGYHSFQEALYRLPGGKIRSIYEIFQSDFLEEFLNSDAYKNAEFGIFERDLVKKTEYSEDETVVYLKAGYIFRYRRTSVYQKTQQDAQDQLVSQL